MEKRLEAKQAQKKSETYCRIEDKTKKEDIHLFILHPHTHRHTRRSMTAEMNLFQVSHVMQHRTGDLWFKQRKKDLNECCSSMPLPAEQRSV